MNLPAELEHYGISGKDIRMFDSSAAPDLVDYLDLVEPRKPTSIRPHGVAESQSRPLLFFVDESRPTQALADDSTYAGLRRSLACRGTRSYLARVVPGQISVVPVALDERMPAWDVYQAGTDRGLTLFSRLAAGQFEGPGEPTTLDQVFKGMFELVKAGADRLAHKLDRGDVLSLVGRALFLRFLQDRRVITELNRSLIAPGADSLCNCFEDSQNASATCAWLDRTFNGDFLHLTDSGSLEFFDNAAKKTRGAVFEVLGSILGNVRPVGSDAYQLQFDWADFDFAHIPTGLLSQVYEKFIWTWEDREARNTSVYYTPRNIAAYIVDEAFEGLPNAHEARIIDPACGAGVFLVLAFRRIYRELWKATNRRPDTRAIRKILNNQLVGFDISDSALKLAALSLYLTAIELDPEPIPPHRLRFTNLRDTVLFNCRPPSDRKEAITVGSLGSHVDSRFNSQFDLVMSNPPWTSTPNTNKGKEVAAEFTNISAEIIRKRGDANLASAYQNPDGAPDLPFVWKSTQWCKPDGRIAMALPARILLKQEGIPVRARHALFQLLEVTGILNGSNLSDTNVWPEMAQPFMLFFARNRIPVGTHVTRLITPHYDRALNQWGELRIDSKSAQPVHLEAAMEFPWFWKALALGTPLDFEVVRKVSSVQAPHLKTYWTKQLGLTSSNGYKLEPKQKPQLDATFLHKLPNLNRATLFRFAVDPDRLENFRHPTAHRPRNRAIYCGPLVLVKEAPGRDRTKGLALISFKDVAFNQSFYGYSASNHPEADFLVRYLHLLIHSKLWMHYALMTSPKLGAERRTVYKGDLDDFPVIPAADLTEVQKGRVLDLSGRLERADPSVFVDIDRFVCALYNLEPTDLEVINDTLDVCSPYKKSRDRACRSVTLQEQERFRCRLELLLTPFLRALGTVPNVSLCKTRRTLPNSPFVLLSITGQGSRGFSGDSVSRTVLRLANETAASQVLLESPDGLLIGIVDQYRYWTNSRARMLAAEIIQNHTTVFEES